VQFVDAAIRVPAPRKFKTVVTSSAGYPLDKSYYRTLKLIVTPMDILAPGGTLIIASECSEGIGSDEFRAAQRRLIELGPDKFLATLTAKSLADVDEWQTEMQLKPMRVGRISLYTSGLSDEERALTGVETVADLDETIARSIALADDPWVAVIPEGPYVVPYFRAG
jgi:lactate racemase